MSAFLRGCDWALQTEPDCEPAPTGPGSGRQTTSPSSRLGRRTAAAARHGGGTLPAPPEENESSGNTGGPWSIGGHARLQNTGTDYESALEGGAGAPGSRRVEYRAGRAGPAAAGRARSPTPPSRFESPAAARSQPADRGRSRRSPTVSRGRLRAADDQPEQSAGPADHRRRPGFPRQRLRGFHRRPLASCASRPSGSSSSCSSGARRRASSSKRPKDGVAALDGVGGARLGRGSAGSLSGAAGRWASRSSAVHLSRPAGHVCQSVTRRLARSGRLRRCPGVSPSRGRTAAAPSPPVPSKFVCDEIREPTTRAP
ncbi:zinc finger CCCH domain-containing protein 18-like [Amphibalanus amphitrite]|uniref:zinc finger CCCH domain-containing protein 18-like n=1 Tax=Amphibalanus amphitrite TaxID=1232801 RepID=UPI001C919E5E|nr:zinc finger CCCH domain-containing protein 18-like [Amphibalanus amphitrite]